jgi:hypothetical protein
MTSNEFVIWFKGFVQAANTYNITPKQWDDICEQLDQVKDIGYTISVGKGNWGRTTTTAEVRNDVTYKQDELTTNTI